MSSAYVGVVGPSGELDPDLAAAAAEVGRLLAEAGCVVVTGGGTGVMTAASRGASEAGGTTLGVVGLLCHDPSPYATTIIVAHSRTRRSHDTSAIWVIKVSPVPDVEDEWAGRTSC